MQQMCRLRLGEAVASLRSPRQVERTGGERLQEIYKRKTKTESKEERGDGTGTEKVLNACREQ